jgi:MFS transporter, FHS family, glucose/mannose:H+ symporter
MTNQSSSSRELSPGRWTLSDLLLGAGFFLTGMGTVMLGVLLPSLSARWGMRDDAAGFLLFLQFLGSSLGASLLGPRRVRGLIAGYGLLIVSVCALAFAGMRLSFVLFFFVGLGLGMAMTATSLLFSDRYPGDRAARLERLNFAWAAGASAGPVLFLPFLRLPNLDPLFFTLTGLFLLLFLWSVLREREAPLRPQSVLDGAPEQQSVPLATLLPLLLMAVGSVGIEASMSGWLTTYSHRADSVGVGGAVFAPSLFWFGIVVSRLLFSTRLLAIVGRRLLRATLWGVAAALALLVAAQHPAPIRIAAMLAGLSIGPLYPLLLSFILKRSSRGWIFAVAGIGSALLPWLTGVLSAHFGSLRYGLIAPGGAAVLMVLLSFIGLRRKDSTDPAAA